MDKVQITVFQISHWPLHLTVTLQRLVYFVLYKMSIVHGQLNSEVLKFGPKQNDGIMRLNIVSQVKIDSIIHNLNNG